MMLVRLALRSIYLAPRAGAGAQQFRGYMKEKIAAIRKALSKSFNAAPVEYVNADGRHRFNLELPKVTHRVHFSLEVLDGHQATEFKRLCKGAASYLQRNPTGLPKQVFVTNTGVLEEK
jgi:hypothetical protein